MSFADFMALPSSAKMLFIVMLWPAMWAATMMAVALVRDLSRQRQPSAWSPMHRTAA
jgi:hypothetical protein